ncbi:MAG: cation diffusion facilitator family transporter [Bacteroidia bacterium]|nr:cation diffusion facilitator family transporter [Bacteroidia bacterium]
MNNEEAAIKITYFSIVGNVLLAVIKWAAGFWGNSYALIADAIESTTDIFASFLVYLGLRYSSRPADECHPYGHGRVEPLITFIVVAFLVTSATVITYESIQNIRNPHELPEPFTLIVLAGIILWKEISFQLVIKRSRQINSTVLKAEAWHHRSDALTSVAAFIGISVALLMGKGFESADDWAAIFAAIFILYNSYTIFRPALGEIMDENFYDDTVKDILKISTTVQGVISIGKCAIRKTGTKYHVDIQVLVDAAISVKMGHEIAHALEKKLQQEIPELAYIQTHIEPYEEVFNPKII